MGIESAARDFANMISTIQNREHFEAPLAKLSRNGSATPGFEQLPKSLVAEALDHEPPS